MQSLAKALNHLRPAVGRRNIRRVRDNKQAPGRVSYILQGETGATGVEYAVLLALLVSLMISGISYFGDEAKALADVTVNALDDDLTPDE